MIDKIEIKKENIIAKLQEIMQKIFKDLRVNLSDMFDQLPEQENRKGNLDNLKEIEELKTSLQL